MEKEVKMLQPLMENGEETEAEKEVKMYQHLMENGEETEAEKEENKEEKNEERDDKNVFCDKFISFPTQEIDCFTLL